jgi:hypothetical protein
MHTTILKSATQPCLTGDWDHDVWAQSETISIGHFRPESSEHHPKTEAKILYDNTGIHLIFRVEDAYVRSVQTALNSPVCRDSCVEFFIQPRQDRGYLNFEINCGGTLLASYIEDWTRTETGFGKCSLLPKEDADTAAIFHSMPKTVNPEISDPTVWINQIFIPFDLLAQYVGELSPLATATWRGNLYKCGDDTSHPHWAAWSPVRDLNFHDPESFGTFEFAR